MHLQPSRIEWADKQATTYRAASNGCVDYKRRRISSGIPDAALIRLKRLHHLLLGG